MSTDVYAAWAPLNGSAIAATATTGVVVGIISVAAVALSNPGSLGGLGQKIRNNLIPEGSKEWLKEFVESKRKKILQEKTGSPFSVTKAELIAYAISLVALSIAFSYVKVPDISMIFAVLPTIFVTAVIVEFLKTYSLEVYARKKGVWTEHRIWYIGLALFIFTTLTFGVPFSSPTRNVYHSPKMTKQLCGLISSVAILVTLAFAALFFGLLVSGFTLIGGTGLAMCLIIGLVDMFPIEPMHGKAIFNCKKSLWVTLFCTTSVAYIAWLLLL